MLLPKSIDDHILKTFTELIDDGRRVLHGVNGIIYIDLTEYASFITRVENLAHTILDTNRRGAFSEIIQRAQESSTGSARITQLILGHLIGLKKSYESGMLDDLSLRIESDVNSDYLGQAEQLLRDEKIEYIDAAAAVVAGAVLEKALRSLCDRQKPPIPTERSNGKRKTLGKLIEELRDIQVFNQPVATRLLSYTQTRNAAAHGEFDKFTRQDVESMIPGINDFLADYL